MSKSNIIFDDDAGNHQYKLAKCNPGWELHKWSDGGEEITRGRYIGNLTKAGWKPMGVYPHNMTHAVMLIADDCIGNKVGDVTLKTALKYISDYIRDMTVYAEGLEATLVSD